MSKKGAFMNAQENNEPYYDDDEYTPYYKKTENPKVCSSKCCNCLQNKTLKTSEDIKTEE